MMSILKFILPMAIQSFKANPFHTFLSILGIIIGVGALFSILSLADGMEKMGREQITSTSNLQSLAIQSKQYKSVDNVNIKIDSFDIFDAKVARSLEDQLENSDVQLSHSQNTIITVDNDTLEAGAQQISILNILEGSFESDSLLTGRWLNNQDMLDTSKLAVINKQLHDNLYGSREMSEGIGAEIIVGIEKYSIIGIIEQSQNPRNVPMIFGPVKHLAVASLRASPPTLRVDIKAIDSYDTENEIINTFLDQHFKSGAAGFNIASYASRMKQLMQGLAVFRIVMGLIVGISVLVGGIGIMNVLLMSIKERTKEIGIKKALGASQRKIKWQFLLEAILISFMGCFLGLLLGVIFMSIAVPLLQHFTEMPFGWVFSLQTTLIIVVIAMLIGLVFGTYPAIKAARLDPIDAIRHE